MKNYPKKSPETASPVTQTEIQQSIISEFQEAKKLSAATDQGKFDEYTNQWCFYEVTYKITNNVDFNMTPTGGNGVWMYVVLGFGIAAIGGAVVVMYDKDKKRKRKLKK